MHRFLLIFLILFSSVSSRLIRFNHKCTHSHLSPNIPKYKSGGKIYFRKMLYKFCEVAYNSSRQLFCCDITDWSKVPPAMASYKKLNFKKCKLLIVLSKFTNFFTLRFLKSLSIHPICIHTWGSFPLKSTDPSFTIALGHRIHFIPFPEFQVLSARPITNAPSTASQHQSQEA